MKVAPLLKIMDKEVVFFIDKNKVIIFIHDNIWFDFEM